MLRIEFIIFFLNLSRRNLEGVEKLIITLISLVIRTIIMILLKLSSILCKGDACVAITHQSIFNLDMIINTLNLKQISVF